MVLKYLHFDLFLPWPMALRLSALLTTYYDTQATENAVGRISKAPSAAGIAY